MNDVHQFTQPVPRRCICNHFDSIHNEIKDEFFPDGKYKATYSDGCRGPNCECLTFKAKKAKEAHDKKESNKDAYDFKKTITDTK